MGFAIVNEIKDQVERMEAFYDTIEQREHYLRESLKKDAVKESASVKQKVKESIESVEIRKRKYLAKKSQLEKMKKLALSINKKEASSVDYRLMLDLSKKMGLDIEKDLDATRKSKEKEEASQGGALLKMYRDMAFDRGFPAIAKKGVSLHEIIARRDTKNERGVAVGCYLFDTRMDKAYDYQERAKKMFDNNPDYVIDGFSLGEKVYKHHLRKPDSTMGYVYDEDYSKLLNKYDKSSKLTEEEHHEVMLKRASGEYAKYSGSLVAIKSMIAKYADLDVEMKRKYALDKLKLWEKQITKIMPLVKQLAEAQLEHGALNDFHDFIVSKFHCTTAKDALHSKNIEPNVAVVSPDLFKKMLNQLKSAREKESKLFAEFERKSEGIVIPIDLIKDFSREKHNEEVHAKTVEAVFKADLNHTNDMLSLQEMNSQLIELTHLYEEAKSAGATSTASNYKHRIDELQNKIDGIKGQDKGAIRAKVELEDRAREDAKIPVINETPAQRDARRAYEARAKGDPVTIAEVAPYMKDKKLQEGLSPYEKNYIVDSGERGKEAPLKVSQYGKYMADPELQEPLTGYQDEGDERID